MRRFIFVVVAVIWVAAPVLACVPNAAMTDAEMACCQKMGGDCDMGVGNHACCKDTMQRAPGVAVLAQNSRTDVQLVPFANGSTGATVTTGTMAGVYHEISVEQNGAGFRLRVCPPGSSPLELNSILRI